MSMTEMTGVRAQAKAERRRRLKAAALAVFADKGYQAATTREIAERAGCGPATLFRYAAEKRDLLLMIVNDDLARISEAAEGKLDFEAPLIDNLLTLFVPRFKYWALNPDLGREALHVTVMARANDDTFETQRYRHRRDGLVKTISELVRRQQAAGHVRADVDPALLAEFFRDIYLAQRRTWLSEAKPNAARGVTHFRRMLELALDGFGAHATGAPRL
jgi:AcrR family transcriptional regulator